MEVAGTTYSGYWLVSMDHGGQLAIDRGGGVAGANVRSIWLTYDGLHVSSDTCGSILGLR